MYLKQSLGSVLIFAIQDSEEEIIRFETLCHNYSISDSPKRLYSQFSFVKTTLIKLFNGLNHYYYNLFTIQKKYLYGNEKNKERAAKNMALKIIREAKEDCFYTKYLEETRKNKEYVEAILGNQNFITMDRQNEYPKFS